MMITIIIIIILYLERLFSYILHTLDYGCFFLSFFYLFLRQSYSVGLCGKKKNLPWISDHCLQNFSEDFVKPQELIIIKYSIIINIIIIITTTTIIFKQKHPVSSL